MHLQEPNSLELSIIPKYFQLVMVLPNGKRMEKVMLREDWSWMMLLALLVILAA